MKFRLYFHCHRCNHKWLVDTKDAFKTFEEVNKNGCPQCDKIYIEGDTGQNFKISMIHHEILK